MKFYNNIQRNFSYGYLPGTNLLQSLAMPNNMTLTQSYEQQRDLLTQMDYKRGDTLISRRTYAYDTLGIPTVRTFNREGTTRNDAFTHNDRQELTAATLGADNYAYAYDNIGNRKTAQEVSEEITQYNANQLNQCTAIDELVPTYDADGNQTKIQTSTGIWNVTYNALNRPVLFTSAGGSTVIECAYDYMGRRCTKKVTVNGGITLHQRYTYRDLTKNICELYGSAGYIRTTYDYTPFGTVTAEGDVTQPIQWSSEYADEELGLIFYNYRHYNPQDGWWINRDPIGEIGGMNLYGVKGNSIIYNTDKLGLRGSYCPYFTPGTQVHPSTYDSPIYWPPPLNEINTAFDSPKKWIDYFTDAIPEVIAGKGTPYFIYGSFSDTVSGYFFIMCRSQS